jgi:hypothetical protein
VQGEGNSVNFRFRLYDPRLGRFFAIDPLTRKYPYNSPYAFSENCVINSVELEGLELVHVYNLQNDGTWKYVKTYTNNDLIGEINRYNYTVNGEITGVVFKNDGLRIAYENVADINGKEYAESFNSIIPSPVVESEPPKNDISFATKMKNEAYNENRPLDYLYYLAREQDESWEGKEGAYKFANAMQDLGEGLSYAPGVLGIAGEILGTFGDGYQSYLDFHYLDPNANRKFEAAFLGLAAEKILTDFAVGTDKIPGGMGSLSENGQAIVEGIIGSAMNQAVNETQECIDNNN